MQITRREMLARSGWGFGALALAGLTSHPAQGATATTPAVVPHFPAKARRVIHLFMNGGPSHVATFDPKPALQRYAGQNLPMKNLRTERKTGAAFPSPYKFRHYGECGTEVSEIF